MARLKDLKYLFPVKQFYDSVFLLTAYHGQKAAEMLWSAIQSPSLLTTPRRLWWALVLHAGWASMQCSAQQRDTSHPLAHIGTNGPASDSYPAAPWSSLRFLCWYFLSWILAWWMIPSLATLLAPPASPFIPLWGCSHSCASRQAPGQQAVSHQDLLLWCGGKLIQRLWKGSFTGGQVITRDPYAFTIHIYKPKGTVFSWLHFLPLTGILCPIAT